MLMTAALLAATAPIVPRAVDTAMLLASEKDEAAVVSYRLEGKTADDYVAALDAALAGKDADLADSIRTLAARQGVPLPAGLAAAVDDAVAEARARMAEDAWNGFVSGHAESEPALAGALAADLTGYGDIRDLYNEASNYAAGADIDTTTVALAAVGLTLTVATVFSLGAAAPEKVGVSTVKVVARMGRLSKPLRREVVAIAREAVDGSALRSFARSIGALDFAAMRKAAARMVRPAQAAQLKQLGADVAVLGRNTGYRGTLFALSKADDAAQVGRMARLSKTMGKATRGALVILGDAALTLAAIAGIVFSWTVGGAFWLLAAVIVIVRMTIVVLRLGFRAAMLTLRAVGIALASFRKPAPV